MMSVLEERLLKKEAETEPETTLEKQTEISQPENPNANGSPIIDPILNAAAVAGAMKDGASAADKLMEEEDNTFHYSVEDDPVYRMYADIYNKRAKSASEDAMGNYAAMTGGVPSTAAVTAAAQAGDSVREGLTDIGASLYQAALDAYNTKNGLTGNAETSPYTLNTDAQKTVETYLDNGLMPNDATVRASQYGYDYIVKCLWNSMSKETESVKKEKMVDFLTDLVERGVLTDEEDTWLEKWATGNGIF